MSPHREALLALGLAPASAAPLEAYLDLLARWSERVNLTAARTAAARVALLVAPVLPCAGLLQPGNLLDVGSGNGSPGLILACLRPQLAVTLLEPRRRRWAFLREAARALGRPDLQVLCCRHDAYPGPPASNLTLRALRLPLASLAPLLVPGGRLIVLGPAPPAEPPFEVLAAPPGLGLLRLRDGIVPRGTAPAARPR